MLKDVGVGENGAKMRVAQEYSLHVEGLNCAASVCELEDHVGEEGLNSNWSPKIELTKKNKNYKFSQSPIRKCLS